MGWTGKHTRKLADQRHQRHPHSATIQGPGHSTAERGQLRAAGSGELLLAGTSRVPGQQTHELRRHPHLPRELGRDTRRY